MKKISFLLGTLGGAMAGYVFSNKKLRDQMMSAKDTSAAAKILGKHLAQDGQVVAKEVRDLAEQHGLDDKIADGRKYIEQYYSSAKSEVQKFIGAKVKQATTAATKARNHAVKKATKHVKKALKR